MLRMKKLLLDTFLSTVYRDSLIFSYSSRLVNQLPTKKKRQITTILYTTSHTTKICKLLFKIRLARGPMCTFFDQRTNCTVCSTDVLVLFSYLINSFASSNKTHWISFQRATNHRHLQRVMKHQGVFRI